MEPGSERPAPATATAADRSPLTTVELVVGGMHCGSCVALIGEALSEHPGVVDASVDLELALATVAFDAAVTTPDALCAVVAETGYTATVAAGGGLTSATTGSGAQAALGVTS